MTFLTRTRKPGKHTAEYIDEYILAADTSVTEALPETKTSQPGTDGEVLGRLYGGEWTEAKPFGPLTLRQTMAEAFTQTRQPRFIPAADLPKRIPGEALARAKAQLPEHLLPVPSRLYPEIPGPLAYAKLMRRVSKLTGTTSRYEDASAWTADAQTHSITAGSAA